MTDFVKTFVLAFYSSFLKIKLNCDKENILILNTYSFQKMLSNLICVLIYSPSKFVLEDSFKDSCVLKILENLQKYIHDRVYC